MIFITCALHCEAKPLIERYRLVSDREAFFPVFKNNDLTLVVTGVGKLLTASAMAYVYARYNEPVIAAWLNVGIAGKKCASIGELYNINKVSERSSSTNWYPVRLPEISSTLNCQVITLDAPDNNYSEHGAYDMEASAFMVTALRFSPVELVQLVKIISDNENSAIEDIDKKFVTGLISNKIVEVDVVVEALKSALNSFESAYGESVMYAQCIAKWRFSEYQKKHLFRTLQQWQALDENAGMPALESLQTAKQVVAFIDESLGSTKIMFEKTND